MTEILGVPVAVLSGQLMLGVINGAFYALLSLGLAVIFGLLKIINFAHGAMYMLGAMCTVLIFDAFGVNYWVALFVAPVIVGCFGILLEYFLLRRIAGQDHIYSLLLTFGIALILQGVLTNIYGVSGLRYSMPEVFRGGMNLGFMFLPYYRAWVIVAALLVCFATWFMIEKTRLGSYLRAGTEDSQLMQGFGINVPLLISLTYGFGVMLAAFAASAQGSTPLTPPAQPTEPAAITPPSKQIQGDIITLNSGKVLTGMQVLRTTATHTIGLNHKMMRMASATDCVR